MEFEAEVRCSAGDTGGGRSASCYNSTVVVQRRTKKTSADVIVFDESLFHSSMRCNHEETVVRNETKKVRKLLVDVVFEYGPFLLLKPLVVLGCPCGLGFWGFTVKSHVACRGCRRLTNYARIGVNRTKEAATPLRIRANGRVGRAAIYISCRFGLCRGADLEHCRQKAKNDNAQQRRCQPSKPGRQNPVRAPANAIHQVHDHCPRRRLLACATKTRRSRSSRQWQKSPTTAVQPRCKTA